jgi:type IV secretion system protein VirB10
MNDASVSGQNAPEAGLANKAAEPKGVIGRNLKMQVYLGIAVLFIVATALSSLHHKTPANKVDPNKPPTPMLQDASATNIEEMKRELAKQQPDATHLPSSTDLSLVGTTPDGRMGQLGSMPYGPTGLPSNSPCGPGQPCPMGTQFAQAQPAQMTPRQEQALAFDTQEKQLAYKARFSSNLAYSQSQNVRGPSSLIAENSAPVNPAQAGGVSAGSQPPPAAPYLSMGSPRTQAQEARPAEKHAAEININSASGQPYVVYEGTILETVLMNRLDGDAVGPVKVMVTAPVYSHDHQHVLVPEGTVVLGEARKIGTAGFGQQRRIAVAFHRMIMPDGYSVDLDQFLGLNQIGETGLKDKVNNHYLQIFGTSIALGLIGAAAEMSNNGGQLTGNGIDAYKYGAAASVSQNATTILDRFISIPPTITIREGYRVKVYISQDMLLPAVENHTIPTNF